MFALNSSIKFAIFLTIIYIMIKLEKMDIQKQIKRNLDGFTIELTLQREVIVLKLIKNQNSDVYHAQIDDQLIKQDRNLGFFFQNPRQFLKFVETSWQSVRITPNGTILILLDMPLGKQTRLIEFKIETRLQQIQNNKNLELRLNRLQMEVRENEKQVQQLKLAIKNHQQASQQLIFHIQTLNRNLSSKDQVISRIFGELRLTSVWKLEQERKFQQIKKERVGFNPDIYNSHLTKFTQIGNRFRKISGGSWDILIGARQIQRNAVTRYHIRQIRSGSNGSFMYGIATEAMRGIVRAQDQKYFVGYYQNTGNVYDCGDSKKGGRKVSDGQVVTIQINTRNWRIAWLLEGVREVQIDISTNLRPRPIFLALIIYNQDSQVEFL